MNTNTVAYWIALGVLVLGLNSEYRHGNFQTLHHIQSQTGEVLCHLTAKVEQSVAMARLLTRGQDTVSDVLTASIEAREAAREQSELVREQALEHAELAREQVRDRLQVQADMLRAQAEIRRAQIEVMRDQVRAQVRMAQASNRTFAITCPKMSTHVVVKTDDDPDDDSSDIEVKSF
jgi:hypothetical protein